MDWAEELKMSLRKTTARKGRRAKSRDTQKDTSSASMSTTSTSSKVTENNNTNKEITLDITLDLQQSSYGPESSTAITPPLTSSTLVDSDRRPPPRRISGGWADNGGMKTSKSKRYSFEDDRFQLASAIKLTENPAPEDDIPVIPDLDDVKDEILLNEIVEPPTIFVNRVASLKELNLDLFPQNAFSAIEDLDLTILTRCLQAPEALDEPDEVWEWDKLFTDVIAEINSDKIDASGNIPSKSPNTNL